MKLLRDLAARVRSRVGAIWKAIAPHAGQDAVGGTVVDLIRGRREPVLDIWCCGFVQTYDVLFRPLFLFFLLIQGSRKVVRMAATRNPTQEWTAQQLRNATMDGSAPKFLIRDRDEKFGAIFDRVAEGVGTRVIKTAVRAPNMNPFGERFVGSMRREVLDHVLLLGEQQLEEVAHKYLLYFNKARPHQGIGQRIPDGSAVDNRGGKIIAIPVLGGLHHDYQRAA